MSRGEPWHGGAGAPVAQVDSERFLNARSPVRIGPGALESEEKVRNSSRPPAPAGPRRTEIGAPVAQVDSERFLNARSPVRIGPGALESEEKVRNSSRPPAPAGPRRT